MIGGTAPKWLSWLERRLGWLEIPHIAVLLVTLQALGFLFVMQDPAWAYRFILDPAAVLHDGQIWRVVTYLALPMADGLLWEFFALWFLYFLLNTLEREWGAFKTTFYVLLSIVLTVSYSLITGYPVVNGPRHFESTLFLAVASLFPEMEILLFMIVPVKMKWLAWVTVAYVAIEIVQGDWYSRGLLLAIYSNLFVFFGPAVLSQARYAWRRRRYRSKLR